MSAKLLMLDNYHYCMLQEASRSSQGDALIILGIEVLILCDYQVIQEALSSS